MLEQDDLWLFEEPTIDEPAELFSMPEIRRHLVLGHPEDDVGLRALLERPEALSSAWQRKTRIGKRKAKTARRPSDAARAA